MAALAWAAPAWRLWPGVVLGGGLAVALGVMMVNPATLYRRLLGVWMLQGSGILGLGGAVELYSTQLPWLDRLACSTAVAPWQGGVWLAVAALLIWRDHARQSGSA